MIAVVCKSFFLTCSRDGTHHEDVRTIGFTCGDRLEVAPCKLSDGLNMVEYYTITNAPGNEGWTFNYPVRRSSLRLLGPLELLAEAAE